MPRFGKDKSGRNEELDRQAAEEVERLTRRGGPPGMGGGGSGAPEFMSSPLDMIAAEMAEKPRPSQRRQAAPRKAAAKQQQAFTPMPSGSVGSSFGPGGLNPGPRGMAPAAPPPAFGGGAYDDDYGGPVSGPPVYNAEPDEDEEMTITELALMDQAAHTGHRPEDLVMQYDAGTAEEMRDAAMRQFYERQQARRPGPSTNSPFAPAGMRRRASGGGGGGRSDDPAVAGGALAQRLANRRRREEEEARRAKAAADPAPAASAGEAAERPEAADDEGALARVLARRRQALGVDADTDLDEDARDSGSTLAPGRRHASSRATSSPGLRAVPEPPDIDEDDDMPAATKSARPRKAAAKARAAKKVTKATAKAPAGVKGKAKGVPAATAAPATPATRKAAPTVKAAKATKTRAAPPKSAKARAAPAPKATKAQNSGATLAKAGAAKTAKAAKARTTGKAKTVFCIECGERNPAIAKFCFNCGNRLAVPEG